MAFHNPYHFVPVKKNNRRGDFARAEFENDDFGNHPHVAHDAYAPNTNSGRIICRLIAETPLVVGAKQERENENLPTNVEQYTLNGKPAIPASTLRGLISNIVETATNSALRVLEDKVYSYRKRADDPLKEIGMILKDEKKYKILPLCDFFDRTPKKALKVRLRYDRGFETFGFNNTKYYYMPRNASQGTNLQPITEYEFNRLSLPQKRNYERGILRILFEGNRSESFARLNRAHELFIYCQNDAEKFENYKITEPKALEVLPEAVERFHELAKLRWEDDENLPYEPIGTPRNESSATGEFRLKLGDLVYFKADDSNKVTEIALSAIWRGRVEETDANGKKIAATTHQFFRKIDGELIPFDKTRKQITVAEQMFGFVENNKEEKTDKKELSLAGRIFPSPAQFFGIRKADNSGFEEITNAEKDFYDLNHRDAEGWTMLKILAGPKPPSPAMYFKQNDGSGAYIEKNRLNPNLHEPQGRKFYLHKFLNDARPWESRDDEEKLRKQKMKVKPVKANTVFYFHFDFENLTDFELGALLYALRPASDFRHKIGLGKPLGLGRVRIDVAGVFSVDRAVRYTADDLLSNSRYKRCWHDPNLFGELGERYLTERKAVETAQPLATSIETLRGEFRQRMIDAGNKEIIDSLELLGNPKKVVNPVRTPTKIGGQPEKETFEWFVNNDRPANGYSKIPMNPQFLKPLPNNNDLPTLEENKAEKRPKPNARRR